MNTMLALSEAVDQLETSPLPPRRHIRRLRIVPRLEPIGERVRLLDQEPLSVVRTLTNRFRASSDIKGLTAPHVR